MAINIEDPHISSPVIAKSSTDELVARMPSSLRTVFEAAAVGVGKQMSLDIADIRTAYAAKPESLTAIYESASKARSERNSWIGWSVFWGIMLPPVVIFTGYKAWENHETLRNIKQQVGREVDHVAAARRAPAPLNCPS